MMSSPRRRFARDESGSDSDAKVVVPSTKRQHRVSCENDNNGVSQFSIVKSTARNESEDTLLQSLNASQSPSTPALPVLPAEILLTILEHAPAAQLLDLRLICKSFCAAIETSVFYHHIQQAELIGYLGNPRSDDLIDDLSPEDYWKFALVRAPFLALDRELPRQALWEPKGAFFRPEKAWTDTLNKLDDPYIQEPYKNLVLERLALENPPTVYSQLRWCVKVGGVALDIGIPDGLVRPTEILVWDFDEGSLILVTDWKALLWNLFREERALNLLLEKTKDFPHYTYGHLQDCLRSMRRTRFIAALDLTSQEDRSLSGKLNNLRPLFREPFLHDMDECFQDVSNAEHDAISTITLLRREAALTSAEHSAFRRLVADAKSRRYEHERLDNSFKKWQESSLWPPAYMEMPHDLREEDEWENPLMWSDEKVNKVQKRVARWKGQREMMRQVKGILDGMREVAEIEDRGGFEDDDSEF